MAYGWDGDVSVANGHELFALVWNAYQPPAGPTWVADVQPIMQQFANLYPVMRDVVDFADYSDVGRRHWRALDFAMTLPVTNPNYMPVTRDLSPAKRAMIVSWLNHQPNPPVFRIDDAASLRQVLQLAIELEHATIPPYLCVLFSIVPGTNQEVAELVRSVVMQEMLHMALVCNLLNAVGTRTSHRRPSSRSSQATCRAASGPISPSRCASARSRRYATSSWRSRRPASRWTFLPTCRPTST